MYSILHIYVCHFYGLPLFCANPSLQISHTWGFFFSWTALKQVFIIFFVTKGFLHTGHFTLFSHEQFWFDFSTYVSFFHGVFVLQVCGYSTEMPLGFQIRSPPASGITGLNIDKKWIFWTTYLPHLVNVVCEQLLNKNQYSVGYALRF